jgi:phosphoglycerate dehydrogenase-like enzyme
VSAADVRVHVASSMTDEHRKELEAVSTRVRLSYRPASPYVKPTELDPELREAEVLIGYHAYFEMAEAPRLRWLQLSGDGVDHLLGAPIMRSDVIVTNSRVFATPIAEYTFGSILSWSYRFPRMHERFQRQRIYPKDQWAEYRSTEINGRTLAIVGYGAIGHRIAALARAFEMNVIATRRSATARSQEDGVEIYPAAQMREMLARADVVVVCLPLTAETAGLVGEAELQAMKPTAYLVSVGRGKVIDESALLRALREGWIGGAGLDVFAQRPLPPNSPFFDLPNVIMTPHMSGVSDGYERRGAALFRENLRRYLAGLELGNVVDKQRGY